MSNAPMLQMDDFQIHRLVLALESITDGELAVDMLIACGDRAIAPLGEVLLRGPARTIALPRCRAARALGSLQACGILLAYLEERELPGDPAVLFAEDAVRSAVARELLRWKSEEVYQVLLRAATRRATLGIVEALGEFRRPEAIPVLFETLEDDLCRNAAVNALVKTPNETRNYAILALRGKTRTKLIGPTVLRRRRATSELLHTIGISRGDWKEVGESLLGDEDAAIVVSAAAVGFLVADEEYFPHIVRALFRVAEELNCLQEEQAIAFLEKYATQADVAEQLVNNLSVEGKHLNWLSPRWRILRHLGRVDV